MPVFKYIKIISVVLNLKKPWTQEHIDGWLEEYMEYPTRKN